MTKLCGFLADPGHGLSGCIIRFQNGAHIRVRLFFVGRQMGQRQGGKLHRKCPVISYAGRKGSGFYIVHELGENVVQVNGFHLRERVGGKGAVQGSSIADLLGHDRA